MGAGKVAPTASEFSAWINLRMSSIEKRVAESWARGPGNTCRSTLTSKGWTRAVVMDRLKAPASNMSQGPVRISGTTQTMPERVPSNSVAKRVLPGVSPCMSSDEIQGSPLVRGAGLHTFGIGRLATRCATLGDTAYQLIGSRGYGSPSPEGQACAVLHILEQLRQPLSEFVAVRFSAGTESVRTAHHESRTAESPRKRGGCERYSGSHVARGVGGKRVFWLLPS